MRTSTLFGDPTGLNPDADIGGDFLKLLSGLPTVPPMTNRAALGFGFDDNFQPLSFARVSIGEAIGPVAESPNAVFFSAFLGPNDVILAPTDPNTTYDWKPRSAQAVPDPVDITTFARALFVGPSNFIEWYFPARLTLDASVTSSLNVQPSGDWRNDVYGMAVTENARVDLPVFAVGGSRGLVSDLTDFDPYRASISPVLRDGDTRSATADGFRTMLMDGYVHLDVLLADDEGAGNGEFGPLVQWMDQAVRLAPPRR